MRRKTKIIKIGNTAIGGDEKIAIQSMTNTPAGNYNELYEQSKSLYDAGCDILRVAVPTVEEVKNIAKLKEALPDLPLVADIHFHYRIPLECISCGVDKIRINPGNIGDEDRVKKVAHAAKNANIPIRIGVNGGSLEKEILAKYSSPTAEALAESAFYHVNLLEKYDFDDIVISVKSSDTMKMIEAVKIIAEKCNYPLHLGVTEAGTKYSGIVKNSVGIGALLSCGIGDTVRVSLTADPIEEIRAAREILFSLGLFEKKVNLISCPTCGRTKIDLISICERFEKRIPSLNPSKNINVAIMGCVVNGPGEAKEADIGIAGGCGEAILFKKGNIVNKYKEDIILDVLCDEINKL